MSNTGHRGHPRLIVELAHGAADADTLRGVAALAALLQLDLHGLFVEDEALLHLAALPFAREIRLPTHEWQKLEVDRIGAELRHAAADARRLLREVAAALNVPNGFEVRRGDPAETIAAVASEYDVVAIAASVAGGRVTPNVSRVHAAAHGSPASLLLLPAGFVPRTGPVVAVLAAPDDPALLPAVRAAQSQRERLLLLVPAGDPAVAEAVTAHAASLGVPRIRVTVCDMAALQAEDVLHALGHARERLVVLTRDASPAGEVAAASRIAADRRVAVLLVEPAG